MTTPQRSSLPPSRSAAPRRDPGPSAPRRSTRVEVDAAPATANEPERHVAAAGPLTGTGHLLRLAWRRDRIMIIVTLVVLAGLHYLSATAIKDLYPSDAARVAANEASNASTGVIAMYGKVPDVHSLTGIGSAKAAMIGYLALAILCIAIVRRHTRAEEESGRFEVIGSTIMGRFAPLAAAVVLGAATAIVAGATATLAWGAVFPWSGALAIGAGTAGVGLTWTALAALACQLSSSNATCGAWVFGSLALAWLLRMIGDVRTGQSGGFLAWLSPIGWAQRLRAFSDERWWPLLLTLGLVAVALATTAALQRRRDLGAGLLPDRPGRADGRIGTPLGLAWRLHRGQLLAWVIAFVVLGAIVGSVSSSIGAMLTPEAEQMLQQLGGAGAMADLFTSMIAGIAALAGAAYGIVTAMRLRAEETGGRTEHVLATGARRGAIFAVWVLLSLGGSALLALLIGLAHAAGSRGGDFGEHVAAFVVYLPAAWIMIAITLLLIGWLPRLTFLGPVALGLALALTELGGLLNLPDWVIAISPFQHVARLPAETYHPAATVIMIIIAAVAIVVAWLGYRRRDIPIG